MSSLERYVRGRRGLFFPTSVKPTQKLLLVGNSGRKSASDSWFDCDDCVRRKGISFSLESVAYGITHINSASYATNKVRDKWYKKILCIATKLRYRLEEPYSSIWVLS
jgi:histidinol phosphatase-like PHP family hydrolase